MSSISPATRSILNQLKQFKPTFFNHQTTETIWTKLPYTRRAAVLVLLFESRTQNNQVTLSTVLTRRGANMSSFSGQVALPGGKADDENELAYAVARREAFEEIALPLTDSADSPQIEYVATLPVYLSRNLLAVQPTIAYMSSPESQDDLPLSYHSDSIPSVLHPVRDHLKHHKNGEVDETAEVAEIFSVGLESLLHEKLPSGESWYRAEPTNWGGLTWNQHWYSVFRRNKRVGEPSHFSVWGLTARVLLDVARIAYDKEPEMASGPSFGDEDLIAALAEHGKMDYERKKEDLMISFRKVFGKDSELLKSRM